MLSEPLRSLTQDEISDFHRDGAVLLKRVIGPEWVDLLREGLEAAFAERDVLSEDLGSLRVDQFPAEKTPALRRILMESPIASLVGQTLGSSVRFYMDQLFYKPAGQLPPTPWHQDTCYYNLEGQDLIRAWASPDPVPREASLEVVRGSHRWNVTYAPLAGRDPEKDEAAQAEISKAAPDKPMLGLEAYEDWSYFSGVRDTRLPSVPEIEKARDSFDLVGWDYDPGDVILFHAHILHGAGARPDSPHPRRAYASLWAGDDVRYLHRAGQIIPDPRALYAHSPQTGQPLTDFPDVFPTIWSPGSHSPGGES